MHTRATAPSHRCPGLRRRAAAVLCGCCVTVACTVDVGRRGDGPVPAEPASDRATAGFAASVTERTAASTAPASTSSAPPAPPTTTAPPPPASTTTSAPPTTTATVPAIPTPPPYAQPSTSTPVPATELGLQRDARCRAAIHAVNWSPAPGFTVQCGRRHNSGADGYTRYSCTDPSLGSTCTGTAWIHPDDADGDAHWQAVVRHEIAHTWCIHLRSDFTERCADAVGLSAG